MHKEHIKAELRIRGWSISAVAADLKITAPAVGNCLAGQRSKRIEAKVAEILDLPVEAVFPGRYPRKIAR